ncbi:MAG: NAD(P)H-dependent oxidoreductase [Flavicella sp.]
MELLDALQWRRACKAMNGQKVPKQKLENVLEAIRLAPTSSGLQPFEVYVISNMEIKKSIREVAFNQSVVSDCSHLLVFAAWDTYTEARINSFFDLNNAIRGTDDPGDESYRDYLLSTYPNQSVSYNQSHAAKQVYIGLGHAIVAAAIQEVDATPMEGFDPLALDSLLGFTEKGLRSTVLLALGYRDPEKDRLEGLKKVRKAKDSMVRRID